MAQIGSILGPTVVNRYAETWGLSKCYFAGACCMGLLQCTMYLYISLYPPKQEDSNEHRTNDKKQEKAGIFEGLTLFWKHDYVKGIFAISCLFMVEVTIVDYTMRVLAKEEFNNLYPCVNPSESCYQ